jgi:predicted PurR-regulated permease PerM
MQVRNIARDLPEIGENLSTLIDRGNQFLEEYFGIAEQEQTQYLKDSLQTIFTSSSTVFSNTLSATTDFFTEFTLVLLSLFFFLYYREFFLRFLQKLVDPKHHHKLMKILQDIEYVVRSYILGLVTVIFILAVLNTTGLMLFGLDYALFFGVFAAMLTIIPFLGVFIGSILPILYAFVTKDSLWYPVGIAGMFWVIQFLEGNFITPNIIGNRISVNPFAIIVALFVGGMMWGPVGMILSVPTTAILKVVFSNIEPFHPYGFLLGTPSAEDLHEKEKNKGGNVIEKVKKKLQSSEN